MGIAKLFQILLATNITFKLPIYHPCGFLSARSKSFRVDISVFGSKTLDLSFTFTNHRMT